MKKLYAILLAVSVNVIVFDVNAQLSISGQLRTRTELRDGQGAPSVKDTVPAFFTSQRTRLNVGYTGHRFKVYTSLQDVRVWGQDASSMHVKNIKNADKLSQWAFVMISIKPESVIGKK